MTCFDETLTIEEIFLNYGKMVSSICRRIIYDEKMAEDAAQETWFEIVKNFPSYRGEAKVSTWIYTITTRTATKYLRNERIFTIKAMKQYTEGQEFVPRNTIDSNERLWVKDMCDKCLTGMLRCLDLETRLIYVFRDIAKLEYSEISIIINKNESTVRKIASRTRMKLRNFLNDECMLVSNSPKCKCRMKSWVGKNNLAEEYNKIRKSVSRINLYRATEMLLPGKNFWENLMK
jgi:RNA polymerase sigma factor (sigma-70 family)